MSQLGGQSEARPPVFKSPSKLGTHLLTHCCEGERLSRPSQPGRERDENGDIIRIWLKFPKSCGRKQATKLRNLSARLNLDDDAVPITSQTSSVALNNNKTIIAKRKHFPLVSALTMTMGLR
ncbi:uvrD_C_2 domain-containing protein [Trichonephila clavipes]|nr:uvrD_C_2 domain-containing protein [Trichonephila clavipes]